MELTNSEIRQFQQLFRTKFGIELDDKSARYKLLKLVRQMYLIYQPITDEQLSEYQSRNEDLNEDIGNEQARATSNS